jgi:hypothetical protein
MKTATQSLPKYSGYPLQPAIKKETNNGRQLTIVKQVKKTSSLPTISLASNPLLWDEAWFNNYE